MMWKKIVLVATLLLAVTAAVVASRSSPAATFREPASIKVLESAEIPFTRPFLVKSLALSGSWEGPGFAQVWVVGQGRSHIVLDTRAFQNAIELSAYGTHFDGACVDTCAMTAMRPERLLFMVSGPGVLVIDAFHFSVPLEASGLAIRRVEEVKSPDHSVVLIVVLLVAALLGAHYLSHTCRNPTMKRVLIFIFLGAFLATAGVFGATLASPTSAFTFVAKKAASVFAAGGVIALFVIGGAEMMSPRAPEEAKQNIWKELEEAEEEWEKRK